MSVDCSSKPGLWHLQTAEFRNNDCVFRITFPLKGFPPQSAEWKLNDMIFVCVDRYHRSNRCISRYVSYGRHEGNEFHYNTTVKTLSVSYLCELWHSHHTHCWNWLLRHRIATIVGLSSPPPAAAYDQQPLTVVHYHCNPNRSSSFIRDQSLQVDQPLQIWVESPCACPNACAMGDLGLGTIFLIILTLSAAAYFILGNTLNNYSPP